MFSSNTSQVADGGYQISRSLRFNSADSAYLNRTPASASNRKTFTLSGWVKRSKLTGSSGNNDINNILSAYSDTSNYSELGFLTTTTNSLSFVNVAAGSVNVQVITTAAYRDASAWYHVVLAVDTTQATASNRVKVYVNGEQVTSFSTATYPAQNADLQVNNTVLHQLGRNAYPSFPQNFDGYMTEMNFIDGQALTPSSFGETNAQTGVWQPKAYSGSYGTNGFYLNFSDNSNTTAATLGKDYSGNGNNWTPNNFSVAAGAGNDSLVDTPTPYGSDSGAGGNVRGNYCTLNPLEAQTGMGLTNGNLDVPAPSNTWRGCGSTVGVTSGKWYWEVTHNGGSGGLQAVVGIAKSGFNTSVQMGFNDPQAFGYYSTGEKTGVGANAAYGASWTTGDIIGVAFDADAGTLAFYKNNVSQGTAWTGLTSGPYNPALSVYAASLTCNFGQRPFAYTAPSGFKALCTQNLPTPTIGATTATQAGKYFDVVLRNGGGSSGGTYSTTVDMSSGALLWDKPRNQASSNYLVDSVRGISKNLRSNTTDAEATDTTWFTNFGSSSFTTGSSDWGTGTTVADWIWAANGSGSSNTAGSITSTVSANTTSGFSIVTYTGTGANATVGHGLGVAPAMIIARTRNQASQWSVYHTSLGAGNAIFLDLTNAAGSYPAIWNSTAPTSSVFSVGTNNTVNFSGQQQLAYCFAEVPGYSRFGSYVGNSSSDGPFVFCGFRPRYIMVKCSSQSIGPGSGWHILDTARNPYNVAGVDLFANESYSEAAIGTTNYLFDLNSNGFKVRTSDQYINNSGQTYIFAAFAEAPFKYALAR